MPTGRLIGWRWGDRKIRRWCWRTAGAGAPRNCAATSRPLTARGYSVVAFDAPGHGMTGGRESSLSCTWPPRSKRCCGQIGPVEAIVGHSLGGAVTGYVMSRGAQVKKAVLLAPPASLTDYSHRFARLLRLPEGIRALMQAQIERRFGIRWSDFEVEATAPQLTQPALIVP